jgi:biopolymer transport protein TolR
MARSFKRPRTAHPISELNVTNLIDLAFTLLIIFMIATPLIQQEQTLPVELPIESKSQQTKPDPADRFETITIKGDGTCVVGSRTVPTRAMREALSPYAAEPRPPIFHLRMQRNATVQDFVTVMDALKQNGLSKFSIDTQTAK